MTEVLGNIGMTKVFAESMLEDELNEPFDLMVVDASGLQIELAERVAWLHGRFPEVPIVVLTSSPTWRRARAVLLAGAGDYMPRSLDDDLLLSRCRSLLVSPP
jgi:DNA-binding NarL/FixJ family response regulator